MGQRRQRSITDEEAALWRHATRDVIAVRASVAPTPPPEPAPIVTAAPPEAVGSKAKPSVRPQAKSSQPPVVDPRTKRRLRRGLIGPEARLDLHGHTQASAHAALAGFLLRSRSRRLRCVIVITGQGRVKGGILKEAVPRWLGEPDLARHVNGWCEAGPRHGGAGALYVMLKRPV